MTLAIFVLRVRLRALWIVAVISTQSFRTLVVPILRTTLVATFRGWVRGTRASWPYALKLSELGGTYASADGKAVQGDGSPPPDAPVAPRRPHPVMFNPGRHLVPEGLPSWPVRPGRDLPN